MKSKIIKNNRMVNKIRITKIIPSYYKKSTSPPIIIYIIASVGMI